MSTLDLTGTGTLPEGGHRMAVPAVRVRVFGVIVALVLLAWGSITLLDNPSLKGFTAAECRELAGVPLPPDCVTDRVPPGGPFSQVTP